MRIYHDELDYRCFTDLLAQSIKRFDVNVIAYCLMPNHFHIVASSPLDGHLGNWMQWLMTSHVRRYHKRRGGSGHIWQGRYKSFPVQGDEHLLTVIRYVERNALRAGLVHIAENWSWSSLNPGAWLHPSPVERPSNWLQLVNAAQGEEELCALRLCQMRGRPYGTAGWTRETVRRLGLEQTMRPRGRPSKTEG